MIDSFVNLTREIFPDDIVPLHRPIFEGNERQYLIDCIDSTFVSSVGDKIADFETAVAAYTGSKCAIATVNGTAALHVAIVLSGVKPGDEVITQALNFVASCNAVSYADAQPIFVDVDLDTLGMSPGALRKFLEKNAEVKTRGAINKTTGNRISACVPMHTFGVPCRISEISEVCREWKIPLIEDAAEALGSYSQGVHAGTVGVMSVFSFNGNKIVTSGGGGMLMTDDTELARRARHITTTAKVPHPYEFFHDEIGFNYRMPNLNAALGCAQMERLNEFLHMKKRLADTWQSFFESKGERVVKGLDGDSPNYWLNAIVLKSRQDRDEFLQSTNDRRVMTRPIWQLMSELPAFKDCQSDGLINSRWLRDRVVNVPSSVPDGMSEPL